MENQNYIDLSENEGSSDEIAEITLIPSRRGRPAKSFKIFGKQKMASTSKKSDQESLTAFESTSQILNDSNPFKQTTSKSKQHKWKVVGYRIILLESKMKMERKS
ncbi:uncharacterized protein OCT59_030148 [Rhizophagus irregularis]|uniref:uncharacterized protein n=1 Tax=Rhizophagus irregularis TaxID=588596 RepID=UPI0033327FF6|nr:hypothetical protein OCT59_030148 [Rhizophagus irregularis]